MDWLDLYFLLVAALAGGLAGYLIGWKKGFDNAKLIYDRREQ